MCIKDDALLLNINGKRLSGATAYERLQKLRTEAKLKKAIGLHTQSQSKFFCPNGREMMTLFCIVIS
ncbi:hypothetical protein ACFGVR_15400 [Mucilaginibacter sp. AW1-3]